ncbi:hypothetical protein BH23ACT11_BH23ACT11_15810 [soil metagenome]
MRFGYYPDTDILYIDLLDKSAADVLEVSTNFVVDVGADGMPVGIEIEHGSDRTNLSRLEI